MYITPSAYHITCPLFFFYFRFLFTYSRKRHRERQRRRQRQAPHGEPDAALHLSTLGSHPEPKARCSTTEPPMYPSHALFNAHHRITPSPTHQIIFINKTKWISVESLTVFHFQLFLSLIFLKNCRMKNNFNHFKWLLQRW